MPIRESFYEHFKKLHDSLPLEEDGSVPESEMKSDIIFVNRLQRDLYKKSDYTNFYLISSELSISIYKMRKYLHIESMEKILAKKDKVLDYCMKNDRINLKRKIRL